MLEGKNPLIAFLRASTRSFSAQSHTKPVSVKFLRRAWNAFARLLDIDFDESFTCPICGPSPTTIVCDGTLLGFRKDLMDTLDNETPTPQPDKPIHGSCHANRMMLKSRKSRELLLKYSGYSRDRKCMRNPKNLTPSEFKQLQSLLMKEGVSVLAQVISRLTSENQHRRAPQPYREFINELSLNTPVCGMLQVAGSREAIDVIKLISSGVDIRRVQYKCELKLIQDTAPVLASFILKLPFSEAIPADVCSLISELCELLLAPFQSSVPQPFPSPPQGQSTSKLAYFPNLPVVRGTPAYVADQRTSRQPQEDQDACRKYAANHPMLTPVYLLSTAHMEFVVDSR